jgi:hypothetical protein
VNSRPLCGKDFEGKHKRMNQGQFQQLKQYVGSDLLNYVLNCDNISSSSDYNQLEFLVNQIYVLDDLSAKIQQCRIQFILQGGYGDGVDFELREIQSNGTSLFNHYRQICGGQFASPTSADPLVLYLQQICIREYPNLLMKSSGVSHNFPVRLNLARSNYDEFIVLVKDDVLNQITNKKSGLDYAFQFTTTDGLEFSTQVCTACSTIITRAFYDSCNRMDYTLPSVLGAIENYIDSLRRLAEGELVNYSSFIGIRGLRFNGFEFIELPGAVLRQFRDISNPGMHTNRTVVSHSGDDIGEYSGHVFEIFHSTRIASKDGNLNTGNSVETNRNQLDLLQKLQFAVVFSSMSNRGPAPVFFEVGFPLISPGNFAYSEGNPGKYIQIDQEKKEKLAKWYGILGDKNLSKVHTPLKRLQYAIFERRNPEDAIVDAIIAWEGMFSEAFETTFKVTGSMAKFLQSGEDRKKLFARLKKLYQLRSDLVHGGSSNLLKSENIEDVRAEVIDIGLECLMKIIGDDRLLSMSSSDRIKEILVYDDCSVIPTQQAAAHGTSSINRL